MFYKIRMLIGNLIGVSVSADIEYRIFNSISIFISLILVLNAFINYILGMPFLSVLMLAAAVTSFLTYYLSRVKQKLNLAIILFGLFGNTVLTINFYYNSGTAGPTVFIFVLLVFLLMAISSKKQHLFWMVFNPALVSVLVIASYYNPGLIKNNYVNRFDRFADFGYSYIIVVLLIGVIMVYFKNTYNQQKALLEEKAGQLKNVNQTKDKLLSIIAHDLRSPLASIQNYLEILNEYTFTSEEKKTMEQELLLKTKSTDQLLSNLLYWVMNQMNGVKVNMVLLNLKETLDPVLHIIAATAREKGIEIDNLLPAAIRIKADKDMLQLMVRNLVANAVKFTPAGGKISVGCKIEGDECKVMVEDNGVGIPEKYRADLFSLKTGSTYGTNQEKGTGLGLVLCKEFTELQNGTIGFTSKEGLGTTFFFKLKLVGQPNIKTDMITKSRQLF